MHLRHCRGADEALRSPERPRARNPERGRAPPITLQDDSIAVKERYLGLHMPGEEGVPVDYIAKLADLLDGAVDMDALLAAAATATPPPPPERASVELQLAPADGAPTIAVALDAAFGFYYRECVLARPAAYLLRALHVAGLQKVSGT